jgi:hypothetical protein
MIIFSLFFFFINILRCLMGTSVREAACRTDNPEKGVVGGGGEKGLLSGRKVKKEKEREHERGREVMIRG